MGVLRLIYSAARRHSILMLGFLHSNVHSIKYQGPTKGPTKDPTILTLVIANLNFENGLITELAPNYTIFLT